MNGIRLPCARLIPVSAALTRELASGEVFRFRVDSVRRGEIPHRRPHFIEQGLKRRIAHADGVLYGFSRFRLKERLKQYRPRSRLDIREQSFQSVRIEARPDVRAFARAQTKPCVGRRQSDRPGLLWRHDRTSVLIASANHKDACGGESEGSSSHGASSRFRVDGSDSRTTNI